MPAPTLHRIPFAQPTLETLATDLLQALVGEDRDDLAAAVVLLPSARVCRSLHHILLTESGRDTLLLPRVQTVVQWAAEQKPLLGLPASSSPDPRLRPLILAPRLAALPWLAEHPESAPGLACELISFFDEARLHRQTELLLTPGGMTELLGLAPVAMAGMLQDDMENVHIAWRLYRELVPRDTTDELVELAARLAEDPPQPVVVPELVMVAGFSSMDPVRAGLLKAALATGKNGRVYSPAIGGPLARLFRATWGAEPSATDPLAACREVEKLLLDLPAVETTAMAPTLRSRLAELAAELATDGDPQAFLAPQGPLTLIPCGSAEVESRVIADRVATIQNGPENKHHRVVIAVADPQLALRIRGHLNDAGIEVDFTQGEPLSALPAGLLVRFILRAALTNLRIAPLLDVLTHPYVAMTLSLGQHTRWTLRLEQMYRRDLEPQGGLGALHRRAEERDDAALNLCREYRPQSAEGAEGMVAFVTAIADAFAPMLPFADNKSHPWRQFLPAVRECWRSLAPSEELSSFNKAHADTSRLDALLSALEHDQDLLPEVSLAEFSSEISRLMGAETAAPHRKKHLPVVITGMVEARLDRCDTLILAGLREGVFPARSPRPLYLPGVVRDGLGLPGWTAALARDAELFTRLLHGAPEVVLTWSIEADGSPVLPSSFVTRLELVLNLKLETVGQARLWRPREVPWEEIRAREETFRASPEAIRAHVPVRPLTKLSWSALRTWRDCSYRFLLERGFALRREEEVQAEFRSLDYGNLVHKALEAWLDPAATGYQALLAGEATKAAASLDAIATELFSQGSQELPQRRLWLENFRRLVPGLATIEMKRFVSWLPVGLELPFVLPLPVLQSWLVNATADSLPDLPARADEIILLGTIDRVDSCRDGSGGLAVVDYKTGTVPGAKRVAELEELQVLLYALAVECGVVDLPGDKTSVGEGFYYSVNSRTLGPPRKAQFVGQTDEGRQLLVAGGMRLLELALAAADPQGEFPVLPRERAGSAPTKLPCTYCDLRGVCRVEELVMPAATERKLDKLVNRKD